jgi:hypothetical protein
MGEAVEHFFVEAFVSELAIEAFDEAVLLRLAWRNIVPDDAGFVLPFQNVARSQLGPVASDSISSGAPMATLTRWSPVGHRDGYNDRAPVPHVRLTGRCWPPVPGIHGFNRRSRSASGTAALDRRH